MSKNIDQTFATTIEKNLISDEQVNEIKNLRVKSILSKVLFEGDNNDARHGQFPSND
jgi:hypothetical protein